MLYTKKGDDGRTELFACKKRLAKNSPVIEALGAIDELNSLLGLCKVKANKNPVITGGKSFVNIIEAIQQNLFIIQAELGGSDKKIENQKIDEMERIIDAIEKELPPIKTFVLSGGTELTALLDYGRAISRRAERRIVTASRDVTIDKNTLAYINRLSSLLYAMARLANTKANIKESPPSYQ